MEALTHGSGQDLLAAWKRAWETRDVEAFMALFSPGADVRLDPFDDPIPDDLGLRAHWNRFAETTLHTELDAERLWVHERTVLAAWHGATTLRATAERVRHRGFLVFDLDAEGRIGRLRGYPQARVVGHDSSVRPEPDPVRTVTEAG